MATLTEHDSPAAHALRHHESRIAELMVPDDDSMLGSLQIGVDPRALDTLRRRAPHVATTSPPSVNPDYLVDSAENSLSIVCRSPSMLM